MFFSEEKNQKTFTSCARPKIRDLGGIVKPAARTSPTLCFGGPGRNRTGIEGFAVLCITTLPPDPRAAEVASSGKQPAGQVSHPRSRQGIDPAATVRI